MNTRLISFCCATVLLAGCVSTPPGEAYDPIEPVNRAIYGFNKVADTVVLRPVAQGYHYALPGPVRRSISNFYSNVDDVVVLANNILQWRWEEAGITTQRLLLNTTFGIGGLFDAASTRGLSKQHGDYGQTLGVWGYKKSMYFVLPFLGPSTIRDTAGTVVNYFADPWALTQDEVELIAAGVDVVKTREQYLEQDKILATVPDEYIFMRDAYLQRRDKIIRSSKEATEVPWEGEVLGSDEYEAPL